MITFACFLDHSRSHLSIMLSVGCKIYPGKWDKLRLDRVPRAKCCRTHSTDNSANHPPHQEQMQTNWTVLLY